VTIAEFPTTLAAAEASSRGGSRSGDASARDFADAGALDILGAGARLGSRGRLFSARRA
jgi:alpha-D-ribose 1-methylphosphonate 5-triphosphate diphosphatase PhnM